MERWKEMKIKQFIKDNKYLILAFFFQYIAPLILLVILAGQSKSAGVALKLWGAIVGVILLIIYIARGKKWISEKKTQEKIDTLKVPVYIRVIQLCVSLVGILVIFLIVSTANKMFNELLLFIGVSGFSILVGHLFLIVDSKNRIAHKITRN